MKSYPKWIYHESKEAKIVRSKEEHEKHGDEWMETPAAFEKEVPEEEMPKKKSSKKDK